jgi:hypothetical protein
MTKFASTRIWHMAYGIKTKVACFDEKITGTKAANSKNLLGPKSRWRWFLSLERKHDRKTVPRPKLFASARILQEQRPQPRKTVLGSSPGEDVFCSSKLNKIEKRRQEQSYMLRRGDYRNKGNNPENCPGFESQWKQFLKLKTKYERKTGPRTKLYASTRRLQKQRPQPRETALGSSPGKMVSVARKRSTIEERRQEQGCLFRREYYRNKGHIPENLSWVLVHVNMFSVPRKILVVEHT